VQLALAHGLELSGQQGKDTAFDQDRGQQILDWIQRNAEKSTPVTKRKSKITVQVNSKL
jgi:hypothetical protein